MPSVNPLTFRNTKIAVIDDEVAFSRLVQLALEEAGLGYHVFLENSLLRGFEFAKRIQPDVILLDIMMGLDEVGWSVLERLGQDRQTRTIPVIVCSAGRLPSGLPSVKSQRIDYLPKPFRLTELLAHVKSLLPPGAMPVADRPRPVART